MAKTIAVPGSSVGKVRIRGHEEEASLEKLDPNLVIWDMRRNIDPRPAPQCRKTIQVISTDLPQTRRKWWPVAASCYAELQHSARL